MTGTYSGSGAGAKVGAGPKEAVERNMKAIDSCIILTIYFTYYT